MGRDQQGELLRAFGGKVSLEGKIAILNDMINGTIPPQEYPLEFQCKSMAALHAELDTLEKIMEEFGPHGAASKELQERKTELAIHMAGHIKIELEHAMQHHHDFIENGIQTNEDLQLFGRMLENDKYWDYLQENDRERGSAATRMVEKLDSMGGEEREAFLENNPRARELDAEWQRAMDHYLEDPKMAKEKWGEDYFQGINDVKRRGLR